MNKNEALMELQKTFTRAAEIIGYLVYAEEEEKEMQEMERSVVEKLRRINAPKTKGATYLKEAILMVQREHDILLGVTKLLYPEIAKMYDTTPKCVERAIGHAIECSWNRADKEVWSEVVGKTEVKPTNKEFLMMFISKC